MMMAAMMMSSEYVRFLGFRLGQFVISVLENRAVVAARHDFVVHICIV